MNLAIYDAFERKVSLTETLIWTGLFVFAPLPLIWLLFRVLFVLYNLFFPGESVFRFFYLDESFRVHD